MEYVNEELIKQVAKNQGIKIKQVKVVLELLKEGNTVPFIARYRKEKTDSLDEEQIRAIEKNMSMVKILKKKRRHNSVN